MKRTETRRRRRDVVYGAWFCALGLGVGCGDDAGRASDAGSGSSGLTATDTDLSAGPTSASASDATATGTGSASGSATNDTGEDSGGIKFDLGETMDASGGCGGMGGGDVEFSYIWIANSTQGTISKINTQTMVEEGRYIVRPDGAGNPSRTSVNLAGDVAVANRAGGITKVLADAGDCVESNGMPGIQTSTGAGDILPWGTDECVAWYTPMSFTTQRPVAWSQGELDPGSCGYVNPKVWTAGAQSNQSGTVEVVRLDGATGTVEETIPIPELAVGYYGPYGGAVDAAGDFWFIDSGNDRVDAPLIRVNVDDSTYDIWTSPAINPYGLAIDAEGRPWIAGFTGGVARFDPMTETFDVNGDTPGLGMMPDAEGRMWVAMHTTAGQGVFALDVNTMAQVKVINLPSSLAWGISIDFYGYVWMVDRGLSQAFRIDPVNDTWDTYDGLVGAYTYSDMTGWGLNLVTNPEG